jgi:biopolymer transport protein ExbD
MRLSKSRGSPILGMNLTPMIDIVFLLIIFFITASQITPLVNFPVSLPQVLEPGDAPRLLPATINIDRDGNYIIAGKPFELEQVIAWLQTLVRDSLAQGQQLRVLIRSDRNASSVHVNRLIPRLTEIGVREVKFSVQGFGGVAD